MLRNNYLLLRCLILAHFIQTSSSAKQHCKPSFCGTINNISYPFRLKDHPKDCGDPRYEISCENNTTASIYLKSRAYLVQAINYQNSTIRVADTSIKKNNTCSFPLYSANWYKLNYSGCPYYIGTNYDLPITFITCPFAMNDSIFTESDECVNRIRHTYIKVGNFNASYLRDMCTISVVAMTSFPFKDENDTSLAEIHHSLLYGFELSWGKCACYWKGRCGKYC